MQMNYNQRKLNPFVVGYWTEAELADFGCFKAIGNNVKIAKNCTISAPENISIGDNVRIDGYTIIVADKGCLVIGNYVHIAAGCCLFAGGGIFINDFCNISHHCCFYSRNDDFSGECLVGPMIPRHLIKVHSDKIILCRHSLLGSKCVVLPGSTVCDGVAVGALSLVKGYLDPWCIYGGVPARYIGKRSSKLLELEKQVGHDRP